MALLSKKAVVCVQHFQKDKFVRGSWPIHAMLQHIAEPQGVSWTLVNQIIFGKSVKTLKLLSVKLLWSWWPNEEIISIDPDRASSNIGCKNSLHTQLRKDYPFIISFWCTCHRLELAIKDSVRAAVILKNA